VRITGFSTKTITGIGGQQSDIYVVPAGKLFYVTHLRITTNVAPTANGATYAQTGGGTPFGVQYFLSTLGQPSTNDWNPADPYPIGDKLQLSFSGIPTGGLVQIEYEGFLE